MNYAVRLVKRWIKLVFGDHPTASNPKVRCLRLLEEVLELAQSEGIETQHVVTVVNQVYSRPPGNPYREFGGVLVTVVGYAAAYGLNMEDAFLAEFERIMDPQMMEKVRKRNLEGDKIESASSMKE